MNLIRLEATKNVNMFVFTVYIINHSDKNNYSVIELVTSPAEK